MDQKDSQIKICIINGKPLLEYTVQYVKQSKLINDFYISTDNKQIIDYCEYKKIKYIRRPEVLGGGNTNH